MYICIPLKHTQYNHKCGAIIAVCSALWEQTFIKLLSLFMERRAKLP